MTLGLAQDVLGGLWSEEERFPTVDDIQAKASEFFGVTLADIRGNNRTRAVTFPRQIAMYLLETADARVPRRGWTRIRRQGPHHRAPCRRQDPGAHPGGSRAQGNHRHPCAERHGLAEFRDCRSAVSCCPPARNCLLPNKVFSNARPFRRRARQDTKSGTHPKTPAFPRVGRIDSFALARLSGLFIWPASAQGKSNIHP